MVIWRHRNIGQVIDEIANRLIIVIQIACVTVKNFFVAATPMEKVMQYVLTTCTT
jgi:hypothetical protein